MYRFGSKYLWPSYLNMVATLMIVGLLTKILKFTITNTYNNVSEIDKFMIYHFSDSIKIKYFIDIPYKFCIEHFAMHLFCIPSMQRIAYLQPGKAVSDTSFG